MINTQEPSGNPGQVPAALNEEASMTVDPKDLSGEEAKEYERLLAAEAALPGTEFVKAGEAGGC